jgi:hypothetical protein
MALRNWLCNNAVEQQNRQTFLLGFLMEGHTGLFRQDAHPVWKPPVDEFVCHKDSAPEALLLVKHIQHRHGEKPVAKGRDLPRAFAIVARAKHRQRSGTGIFRAGRCQDQVASSFLHGADHATVGGEDVRAAGIQQEEPVVVSGRLELEPFQWKPRPCVPYCGKLVAGADKAVPVLRCNAMPCEEEQEKVAGVKIPPKF